LKELRYIFDKIPEAKYIPDSSVAEAAVAFEKIKEFSQ